ncbi:hypothetical protein M513_09550 [Trichuris suis]|uniref:Uncharacterized protein n=1 Tax=Trichuris suis TaxID=68888 RepID=A0A085LXB1_9BILA|nr:hypothetical protein M513_09550 [Trichuris suis]
MNVCSKCRVPIMDGSPANFFSKVSSAVTNVGLQAEDKETYELLHECELSMLLLALTNSESSQSNRSLEVLKLSLDNSVLGEGNSSGSFLRAHKLPKPKNDLLGPRLDRTAVPLWVPERVQSDFVSALGISLAGCCLRRCLSMLHLRATEPRPNVPELLALTLLLLLPPLLNFINRRLGNLLTLKDGKAGSWTSSEAPWDSIGFFEVQPVLNVPNLARSPDRQCFDWSTGVENGGNPTKWLSSLSSAKEIDLRFFSNSSN